MSVGASRFCPPRRVRSLGTRGDRGCGCPPAGASAVENEKRDAVLDVRFTVRGSRTANLWCIGTFIGTGIQKQCELVQYIHGAHHRLARARVRERIRVKPVCVVRGEPALAQDSAGSGLQILRQCWPQFYAITVISRAASKLPAARVYGTMQAAHNVTRFIPAHWTNRFCTMS